MSIYLDACSKYDREPSAELGKWIDHYQHYSDTLSTLIQTKAPRPYTMALKELNSAERNLRRLLKAEHEPAA